VDEESSVTRARELHNDSIVILAHDHLWGEQDLDAMRRGGVTAKTLKLTVDSFVWDKDGRRVPVEEFEGWFKRALVAMDSVYATARSVPDQAAVITSAADIVRAKQENKVGIVLGLEGPRPIEGNIEALRVLHDLGLREMQLTWVAPNQLITDDLLNDFGRRVVREMNRLGMLIDLSHLSDEAFHQVLELTEQPPIMSHTACWAVSEMGDTMTDEKIEALAAKGGVMALHFVSGDYIKARHGTGQAVLDDLIDHVDHVTSLVGIDYVALGGDYFPKAADDKWTWVKEVEDISLMPNLTRGLVKRGYSDEQIRKILGGNLLRLYEEVWGS